MCLIKIISFPSFKKFRSRSFSLFIDRELDTMFSNPFIDDISISWRFHLPEFVFSHHLDIVQMFRQSIDHQFDRVSSEEFFQLFNIINFISHFHNIFCLLFNKYSVGECFWNANCYLFQYLITYLHDSSPWEWLNL